jgi:hydroxymethylpyrimidine pyrophosphatase-like HAD family hydrolase
MRINTIACDYDGTLACEGRVDEKVIEALRRFKDSGRKLLLVTGRELEDLQLLLPPTDLFERLIVENGAVLHTPRTGEIRLLSHPPPEKLIESLHRKQVTPLRVGRVILAARVPHEKVALEAIHELGLEYQIIFNKGSVMLLPSGVNKASGLRAALKELRLSPNTVAGIGDAENDHAFLEVCGFPVAVANALPALKEHVAWVTPGEDGAGVVQLIERVLEGPA